MTNLKKIKNKETVSIVIAIPPTEKINEEISSFVRSEFGEDVVFEISVKPEILGGAILIFEGYYRDYSLATKLDEAFETKREEISRVMDQEA